MSWKKYWGNIEESGYILLGYYQYFDCFTKTSHFLLIKDSLGTAKIDLT